MKVQVITDSTSDIAPELAEQLGIRLVPIYLHFGNKTYLDGVDIRNEEFYSLLASSPVHPTTSQPNPEDFVNVYKEYCNNTAGIVSIHISSKISGTYDSALAASRTLQSHCPIEVIDSKFNSAGLGLVVTSAARLAQSGASFSEVVNEAKKAVSQVSMFGIFGTMKYLARSGRVNKVIALTSQILTVMPLLTFKEGQIIRAGLVRTFSKGLNRILEFAEKNAPIEELSIVHSAMEDKANLLKQQLSRFVPEGKISVARLGAGLGVHGGPGVIVLALRKSLVN
jgi:DegV family protein with EDD domain